MIIHTIKNTVYQVYQIKLSILAILLASLAACTSYQNPTATPITPAVILPNLNNLPPSNSFEQSLNILPNWSQDNLLEAWPALLNSCQKIGSRPVWQKFCKAVQLTPNNPDEARELLQKHLIATVALEDHTTPNRNIATAYFEPVYSASLQPVGGYQWPLYAAPLTATTLKRNELTPVDGNVHRVLQGKELAYLDNPIDAFLAQIQGSVRLKLQDGSIVRLGFAAKNNQSYQSIANTLIAQGVFKTHQASMERIKEWAKNQPDKTVQTVLNTNPSFVFFKVVNIPHQQGPIGALGVSLTPMRSVAVDTTYIPLGSIIWLETQTINGTLSQLMLAQDTGGAIKGPSRIDIYTGTGEAAGKLASGQKSTAKVWLLSPKP
jgi:membrane-bound lytic murein transglycosylase A